MHDVLLKVQFDLLSPCDLDLVDTSDEICLVAFHDECTRFYSIIEIDKV